MKQTMTDHLRMFHCVVQHTGGTEVTNLLTWHSLNTMHLLTSHLWTEQKINSLMTLTEHMKITKKRGKEEGPKEKWLFHFHKNHPLHASHVQVLSAKQPTLIFNAHPPKISVDPPPPLSPDATNCKREKHSAEIALLTEQRKTFAMFYSGIFLPHPSVGGNDDSLTQEKVLFSADNVLSFQASTTTMWQPASSLWMTRMSLLPKGHAGN